MAKNKENPYVAQFTHLPVLLRALCETNGPVLEMGLGYYSTFPLHYFCLGGKRYLRSVDNSEKWCSCFDLLKTNWHEILCVKNWEDVDHEPPPPYTYWDVAFIDHAPAERRKVDIVNLKSRAKFIVVHDTQDSLYRYETVFPDFKYRYDYRELDPWTTVVSDFMPLFELPISLL